MKKWPKNPTEQVSFPDIMDPLVDLMKRVKAEPDKNHKYTGYEAPDSVAASYPSADECGKKSFRDYSKERDRDVDQIFLIAAFHLGMAQGERGRSKELQPAMEALKELIEVLGKTDAEIAKDRSYIKQLLRTINTFVNQTFKV